MVDFDELNDRQKKALELAEKGSVRTKDLSEIFNEVRATLTVNTGNFRTIPGNSHKKTPDKAGVLYIQENV